MTALPDPRPAAPTVHPEPTLDVPLATAGLAGVALGVLHLVLTASSSDPLSDVLTSSAASAVAAFLLARHLRVSPGAGAAVGAVLLVGAAASHQVLGVLAVLASQHTVGASISTTWIALAALAGAVFGAAGAWSLDHDTWRGAAALSVAPGVLFGEALLRLQALPPGGSPYRADALDVVVLTALLGVVAMATTVRDGMLLRRVALLTPLLAVVCLGGFHVVRVLG
ncbi:hypothetical protein BH11ACT8_BH11ACT8_33270 [soil metagenome]